MMKKIIKNRNLRNIIIALAAIVIYLIVLKKFDSIGVFWTRRQSLLVEGPIVVSIYCLFLIGMKKGWFRYFAAAVPVACFYIVFETYYKIWNTPFKFITVKQLPELLHVLDIFKILVLVGAVILLIGIIFSVWDFKNYKRSMISLTLLLLIFFSVDLYPQIYMKYFSLAHAEIIPLRDADNIYRNGRLSMTLYWEAKRRLAVEKLEKIVPEIDNAYELQVVNLVQNVKHKKNIHLIVLESFFDPSLFRGVKFSQPPLHPKLAAVFQGKLGVSRSPVFGGRTAQPEFEVLTGVPAFAEFSDIDFNIFSGSPTYSLPWILRKAGYQTIVTNSYMLNAFNADNAYHGLYFEEVYFPKEYANGRTTYIERGNLGKHIFMTDKYLLRKNLEFITQRREKNPDKPIFNYVLGVDGHWPFDVAAKDKTSRIKVLEPKDFDKELLEKYANQVYGRSKAIADYIEGIEKIDPESIVIIVGDHLPRLELGLWKDMGPELYKKLRYLNDSPTNHRYSLIAGISNGKAIEFNNISHYNVPEFILNYITDNKYCSENTCFDQDRNHYHDRYLKIIARAAVD